MLKIEPEQVRSFEEVAAELKKELATERARAEILPLYDKIEDARSRASRWRRPPPTSSSRRAPSRRSTPGRDPSGAPVTGIPEAQRLLTTAFATEVGVENDPLQVEGGYVWYEVAGITPCASGRSTRSRNRSRRAGASRNRDPPARQGRRNARQAQGRLDVRRGRRGRGLKVETMTEIKRGKRPAPLSAATIDAIFRTAKDAYGSAEAAQPAEQVVFRVTDIMVPKLDANSEEAKQAREALNRCFTKTCSADISAGSRPRSASRSTRTR